MLGDIEACLVQVHFITYYNILLLKYLVIVCVFCCFVCFFFVFVFLFYQN